MDRPFVNRDQELMELARWAQKSASLLVIFGRRRVGKTRLLLKWLKENKGAYSQAIEAATHIQIEQVLGDLSSILNTQIKAKTWIEFFEILDRHQGRMILCLDEFPYLVASDPTLPSLLQRFLDHKKKRDLSFILCGSSMHMMHRLFLNRAAPLYGRAWKTLHIRPMPYAQFCRACRLEEKHIESFVKFSLVGGIPKYWESIDPKKNVVASAEELYFSFAPYMENEPRRVLQDESVFGLNPISVLEAIGRGAEKPSEIASRIGVPQTQMSKVLYQLMDASILSREIPFLQSERNPKNVLYRISDPTIRFWYRVYSPHRSMWSRYSPDKKTGLLWQHASTVFEDYCRERFPQGRRYWEKNVEFDLVMEKETGVDKKTALVFEIKFRKVGKVEKEKMIADMRANWAGCKLSRKFAEANFDVLDEEILARSIPENSSRGGADG